MFDVVTGFVRGRASNPSQWFTCGMMFTAQGDGVESVAMVHVRYDGNMSLAFHVR